MYIEQEGFSVLNQPIGVFQVGFAFADGFDFSPAEGDASLELLKEEVVVTGCAVLGCVSFAGGHGVAVFGLSRGFGRRGRNGRVG